MTNLLLISSVYAAEGVAAAPQQGSPYASLLIFAGLFGLMWFFLIRPQAKKQKQHRELVANLKVGDEVIAAGGILGKIASVQDDMVTLETSKTELLLQRQAVQQVLPKGTLK